MEGVIEVTSIVINLDDIYLYLGDMGLAEHSAYGLRVRAVDTDATPNLEADSDMIIIIDTPVLKAIGSSRDVNGNREGSATMNWKSLEQILDPDSPSNYAGGTYHLRYLEHEDAPGQAGWRVDKFKKIPGSETLAFETATTTGTSTTISSLTPDRIYAIQLIKRDTGPSDNIDVFAARFVFVWPYHTTPDDGARVATFPLTPRLTEQQFRYTICGDTFGPIGNERRGDWEELIKRAFAQWSTATAGLVTSGHALISCAFGTADDDGEVHTRTTIVNAIRVLVPGSLPDDVLANVTDFVAQLQGRQVIPNLSASNRGRSEVFMYDDIDPNIAHVVASGAFFEIADDIGYWRDCWFNEVTSQAGRTSYVYQPPRMCASSIRINDKTTTDIMVRRGAYDHSPKHQFGRKIASDNLEVPAENASFNMCRNKADNYKDPDNHGSAFTDMLHEVGHALGIGGGEGGRKHEREHSSVADSVMNYQQEPDCAPHPLDVMAVYALYQAGFDSP
ncbi:MAG: hypothetical protein OXP73_05135 [Chloroflexota bacterium]|nr:hypothetical protein [Chloroflexota bacterium]